MFNKKKIIELTAALEAANKKIEDQEIIIKNLDITSKTLSKLNTALDNYEKEITIATQNEINYIHAFFKTIIGMINNEKIKIINDVKAEMNKVGEHYIENILKKD